MELEEGRQFSCVQDLLEACRVSLTIPLSTFYCFSVLESEHKIS